jgi:uncharacterized 2Fe-2S/4Fe-4S cluster protein (DUF4445 family)
MNVFRRSADSVRVKDALMEKGIPSPISYSFPVLETMSNDLRSFQWHTTLAMRRSSVIAILPVQVSLLGLAIDVGTTKLAAYLCDLTSGTILAKAGAMNPQTAFGEDVISRISYSNTVKNGNKVLQNRLIETLNLLIEELCSLAKKHLPNISSVHIVEAVVVGNTAMHHIFSGLPVWQLGTAPYVPAVSEALSWMHISSVSISLGAITCPNIAGYVGADHIAMLLSTGILSTPKRR